ncbi:hypothetical protein BGP_6226 [Beggiatoa sp. PS]|nr:hypothetical protein BGP_6226 [Beggiatoa sp. PS]
MVPLLNMLIVGLNWVTKETIGLKLADKTASP